MSKVKILSYYIQVISCFFVFVFFVFCVCVFFVFHFMTIINIICLKSNESTVILTSL